MLEHSTNPISSGICGLSCQSGGKYVRRGGKSTACFVDHIWFVLHPPVQDGEVVGMASIIMHRGGNGMNFSIFKCLLTWFKRDSSQSKNTTKRLRVKRVRYCLQNSSGQSILQHLSIVRDYSTNVSVCNPTPPIAMALLLKLNFPTALAISLVNPLGPLAHTPNPPPRPTHLKPSATSFTGEIMALSN